MRRTLLAALALLLTACSSGTPGGSPTASPTIGPPLYTDPAFGFSVTYSDPYRFGTGNNVQLAGDANNPPARTAMFYDSSAKITAADLPKGASMPKGAVAYPVAMSVSVFPLAEAVTPENWAKAKAQVEQQVVPQLRQSGIRFSPVTETKLADRPALTTTATTAAAAGGIPSTLQLHFVFDGSNQYQVTAQAPTAEWKKAQPTLAKMVQSVALPGAWPEASRTPSATS